uniref:Uncharacterized protein n=1 Tax=Apteryx owenii TaxID=8824 RepID=A0A8B9SF65_APTOW
CTHVQSEDIWGATKPRRTAEDTFLRTEKLSCTIKTNDTQGKSYKGLVISENRDRQKYLKLFFPQKLWNMVISMRFSQNGNTAFQDYRLSST